jgi:hypothetical protein
LFLMLKWNIKAIRTSIRVKTLKAEWCWGNFRKLLTSWLLRHNILG